MIETLIGDANQLVSLFSILGKNRDAMIHAYSDGKLQRLEQLGKYCFDATAQGEGLWGIGLREEQGEFIAADTESGVGSAQGFLQGSRSGAQYVIAARMAVLVIYFLEAVQVQGNQTQRLAIAPSAIEFFFKCFSKEPAVVETGQGIGHSIEFQSLQLVILDEDGNTKKTGGRKDIRTCGFQRKLTTHEISELAAAREHLIPNLYTLSFAQIEVSDRTEISLEKLAARRQIEAFERVCQQLEIGILNRQTQGGRGAGAGNLRLS